MAPTSTHARTYKGQTALMWAAAERHPEVVKLLLEHGADWKVRSFDRETKMPKLSAASSVTPIARGGLTAFLFAAREGDIEPAKAMLDAGVDINQTDVDGTTALVVSIMNKQLHVREVPAGSRRGSQRGRRQGPRGAVRGRRHAQRRLFALCRSRKTDDPMPSLEIVKALLARGANPNAQLTKNLPGRSGMDSGDTTLDEGTTPLMRAARSGDAAVMRVLLEKGADPKLTTKEGNTA